MAGERMLLPVLLPYLCPVLIILPGIAKLRHIAFV